MRLELFPNVNDTLFGVSTAIRMRRTTCREVFERCRGAVAEQEGSVKAWVHFGGDEVERAIDERDEELKRGEWRGPLHGIPIGVKDIYDVAGQPTLAGIPNRESVAPASADSAMVQRLRNAGAIIVGKTVTTPYAYFDPPPTRNPWNLERTPGGSSSGSAAAVATGMCLAALGSQTGGSITRPSSFCGIAGYKPTFRLLSRRGMFPFSPSLDHPGPMARTVSDLISMMTGLAHPLLQTSFEGMTNEPFKLGVRGMPNFQGLAKFVVPEGEFFEKAEPAIIAAVNETIELLSNAGAEIERKRSDEHELPKLWTEHRRVMAVEIAMAQADQLRCNPDEFTPAVRSLIEEGLAIRAVDYAAAVHFQRTLRRRMARAIGFDVWLMPAARGAAPTPETTGDPCMNSPWSFLGFPTITIPMALSPEGLPLGLQLIAGPGRDIELFRVARWCENALKTFWVGK